MKKDSLDSILKFSKLHFTCSACSAGRLFSWTGLLIFIITVRASAQSNNYSFNHLTTANGLSSNSIGSVTTDKDGYLWLATSEGLNKYDGYTVSHYLKEKYPNIPSDNLNSIFCDSKNRIWLADSRGIAMIDINRSIRSVAIDSNKHFPSSIIIESKTAGIIVVGPSHDYVLAPGEDPLVPSNWKELKWTDEIIHHIEIRDVIKIDDDRFLFVRKDQFSILNYASKEQELRMDLRYSWTGCPLNKDEVIIGSQKGILFRINIHTHSIVSQYELPAGNENLRTNANLTKIRAFSDSEFVVATSFRGIYIFNYLREKFNRFQHDPLNDYSISEDRAMNIFKDQQGNVFVCTNHSGLNIFNNLYYKADYVPAFLDAHGNIFDGYINDIETDRQGRVWLATYNRLICLDKSKNSTKFFPYYSDIDHNGNGATEMKTVCIDSAGRIWASAYGQGVLLLEESSASFKEITHFDSTGGPLKSTYVHDLQVGPDGRIWGGSGLGIFSIDPVTHAIDEYRDHPQLKELFGKRVFKIFIDRDKRIWFASQQAGVFCYDASNHTIKNFSFTNGLPSNGCICIAQDQEGKMYVATTGGLAIIDERGIIKVLNRSNGLKTNICNGLLCDTGGRIWIANGHNLIRYTPGANEFKYFGEDSGFPDLGFMNSSFYGAPDGRFYWAMDKGLISFYPALLGTVSPSLHVNISSVAAKDSLYQFSGNANLSLPFRFNNPAFYFSAINLGGSKNIFYQYLLEGYDKNWNAGSDITMAKYGSLPPGKYRFMVKASQDGINWKDSSNYVMLNIAVPFWKSWWFITSVVLVTAVIIFLVNKMARRRRKEKENIRINYEKKIAAVEMNALRAQMNPHFIFNSLNSINTFILKNDQDNATECLNKFSQLVRLILDNSRSEWIILENEMRALELYIDLESIRFENIFTYSINIDPDIERSAIMVPPLIIQPYVENAIRHGLIHRNKPGGKLSINVWKENSELKIQVDDNGIGRKEAERLKSTKKQLYQSHGMQITAERLSIINEVYKVHATVEVSDLNGAETATGTRVLLTIQYKTNAGNHH